LYQQQGMLLVVALLSFASVAVHCLLVALVVARCSQRGVSSGVS
jgi:hypothetical protein